MRELMKGNDAIAEAVVRAGCRFFSGYPITPQTEILEYLSVRLPEVGGSFVQSESEIAGISMVYGAAAAGMRAMTSSSGPGYSLLHEGISYIASAELPCLIVNVMRYGSGLGDIYVGQSDYWQAVKNGGHGDYRSIVYAPASVQEAADLVSLGFDKAEQYRNPVTLLSDASISQMMEPVEMPEMKEHDPDKFEWSLKGRGKGPSRSVTSVMYFQDNHDEYMAKKYKNIEENEQLWEETNTEDAEVILVSYGISSRVCDEAVAIARKEGLKVGLIRPISLYPYPVKAFEKQKNVKAYISVEMTALAQMAEDVALACKMKQPVYALGGMNIFEPSDVLAKVKDVLNGTAKEVF
ncbi:2-oxoglutarate ferredoxin oxidoreductase subunit alpha [Desulfonispora thiosulfatigenes DSM 11270]|uniref:2-oxoglutarate ferredoxin oxidoreductase subunit alpha n=1 Tax=Desulfonispora thiosulfatigenes DSM 11270 TaxID=656914 RepID=A0A1W1VP85_DESTI|nr:3-methyl-2-oxobutanoate dehydrogenase subunit VorB [Desulfonispora thiosulfatigenes]SMB95136.1 2-oxoglutarate ferredoxin oxidoreductase subunit alpha [Desulfonispora thiosulfatigenes DSM 11270]